MQPEPWQIHVAMSNGGIQAYQDVSHSLLVFRMDASFIAAFQACVDCRGLRFVSLLVIDERNASCEAVVGIGEKFQPHTRRSASRSEGPRQTVAAWRLFGRD